MANNLFQKIAEIWLNLKQKTQVVEGNSIYGQSLAAAAIEAFDSNMGNFSTDWLASGEKLNKELVVCTALVDPFVHSQLECICEKSSNVRMRPVEGYRYAKGKYFVFEKIENSLRNTLRIKISTRREDVRTTRNTERSRAIPRRLIWRTRMAAPTNLDGGSGLLGTRSVAGALFL
uniref:Uncharacterized protein n=1 Tax=Ditylenchus dipsaci TaxID=166011 RepID=A0A915D6A7_9BILA